MVKNVGDVIEWQSVDFAEKEHSTWWYIGLCAVTIAFGGLAFFLEWWTFLVLVVLIFVVLLMQGFRKPNMIPCKLDSTGITEGKQLYKYEDYRAFGILKEGSRFAMVLIPKKRFGMQAKIYFLEQDGEKIVNKLGARLPMEEVRLDFLDKIVDFLRI